MTIALVLLLLNASPRQPASSADSMRALAERQDSAALAAAVRRRPDEAREALGRLLSLAASPSQGGARAARVAAAARLAGAYAEAWRDSFPLRHVAAFAGWTPERRAAKVAVDSLRRAGIDASRRLGVAAAMPLWRESLRRAAALGDSAGRAAALGNLGAGFYMAGEPDSAAAYLARARDLAAAAGDVRTAGNAVGTLASVSKDRGDLARAQQLYAQALAMRERVGDVGGMAGDHNNLGLIAQAVGDPAGARRAFEAALALNRRYDRARNAATNLTNLANLASLAGDYARAAALYREALAVYRGRGDRVDEAFVLHAMGLLGLRRGDYGGARALLAGALATYEVTGPVADAIAVRRDLATALAATGDLQGALTALRRAERRAAAARAPALLMASLAMARADLAVQLNTLAEADREYARAARLYRAADDGAGLAAARRGRGLLLLLRQDYAGGLGVLQAAESGAEDAVGDRRAAASARLLIGYALEQRGDPAAAHGALTRALSDFRSVGDVVGEATALAALGDLEQRRGMTVAAESLYNRGLARLAARPAPGVAWQLHAGLGEAMQSRGALADAARELRAAIADVERVSATLRLEERRGAFLEDKWPVYARLALVERTLGRDADAFAVSERMRARQMLDLLARGRVTTPDAGDSARGREQDLRRQITELTRAIEASAAGAGGASAANGLRGPIGSAASLDAARDALNEAQRSYADLLLEMRERSPQYARLVGGEAVTWRDVASRLAPDEALIEYLVSDSTTLAFVVTAGGVASVDLNVPRRTLATLVDFTRATLSRPVGSPAGASWKAPLRRLHRLLVGPLEAAGYLNGKRALVIAPHGELHYLPFAALLSAAPREEYLIERYTVSFTPSASLWIRLGERRAAPAARSGSVLALAPRPGALPGSRGEVQAIGTMYGDRATVLTAASASERAFRTEAPRAEVIHLATYGVLNKWNPLFSFVELAPGNAAAADAAEGDGRLEVHEVFGLSLSARLVVLSACQTALGSGALGNVPAGDDWVGLGQAFLFAGAANVVATLWPVEDRVTGQLMQRFYAGLRAGRPEAEALAEMQRGAVRGGAAMHPFYWAGFSLAGRRDSCAPGACGR